MLTVKDVQKMLAQGKQQDEIRREYFKSIDNDLHPSFKGSGVTMLELTSRLKEIGVNLNQIPHKESYMGYTYWDIQLQNTLITIIFQPKGRNSSIRFFSDSGASNWYLSYINPDKIIDAIKEADQNYPKYLQTWASYEKEITKFGRVKALSEAAIENIVKEKLRGTGIQYNLVLEPTSVLLKIKMRRSRYFEIKLPHDGFSDILTDALIEDIRKVSELLNGLSYTCKIQRFGSTLNWYKSE